MDFLFDEEEDLLLRERRGVCFHDVIRSVEQNGILLDMPHPAKHRYPNQRIFIVEIDGYAFCVPYAIDGDTWILKTVYPNRKFKYLVKGGQEWISTIPNT